jgi:hypothetical protein
MRTRMAVTTIAATAGAALFVCMGCSASGAAHTGFNVFQNTKANQLGVRIFLDGHEAARNELKQAATGYSRWRVSERVSTRPKLRFEFKTPDALGRIRMISLSIFQKFEADYSDQAEFTIVARDNDPQAQMRPDVEYDLGEPGPNFRVLNFSNKEVSGVSLKPGLQYMLVFTVSADKSETAQVYFETN